jgi:hypothetical protein
VPRFFFATGYWVASAVVGGMAVTLVYFVVVPFKAGALPPNMAGLFAIGGLLNGARGIGWALLFKLFAGMRGES